LKPSIVHEYDFGVEHCAGDSGGYGYQVSLALENLDLARARKFWEVDALDTNELP
jgi:hypothetical protein